MPHFRAPRCRRSMAPRRRRSDAARASPVARVALGIADALATRSGVAVSHGVVGDGRCDPRRPGRPARLSLLHGRHILEMLTDDDKAWNDHGDCGRGGRYDGVGRAFGGARPATGFTLDLRRLATLVDDGGATDAILAPNDPDPALATAIAQLRAGGRWPGCRAVGRDRFHRIGADGGSRGRACKGERRDADRRTRRIGRAARAIAALRKSGECVITALPGETSEGTRRLGRREGWQVK